MYEHCLKVRGTPAIQVILEHHDEQQSFCDEFINGFGYRADQKKQNAVASKFLELINHQPDHDYDVDDLFVEFLAFAPLALQEAESKISDRDLKELKNEIGNPDIWRIFNDFADVTFMFYTDAQVNEYTAQGKKNEYMNKYLEILKPHDEFNYLSEVEFRVDFGSKQELDEKHGGDLHSYFN